jgi:dUTP pyrophosphatase
VYCEFFSILTCMKVEMKRVDATLPLPKYETEGAVAFDFTVRETIIIQAHGIGRIPSNLIIKVPKGFMLYVRDRSSTAVKKGLLITAGIIDQDYCGEGDEILLQFYNYTDNDVTIARGERIAQGIFVAIERAEWSEVAKMDSKTRGGFGTTG